jgi:predicted O-methyltransferase YrrM
MRPDHEILQSLIDLNADTSQCVSLLYAIPIMRKAEDILELGVRQGISTIALLTACRRLKASLVSLDVDPCVEAEQRVKSFELENFWSFVLQDDREWLKHADDYTFEIVFIDTDHNYEHMMTELTQCDILLAKHGVMLVHDTLAPNYADIIEAINDFLTLKKGKYEYLELGTRYGLGMLTKKK